MEFNRILLLTFVLLGIQTLGIAQSKWSVLGAYETNYMGNNMIVHLNYTQDKHQIQVGPNYNLSDGFSNNPVVGIGISYFYKVLSSDKWEASIGVDYRRQKPIKIVNIQTILFANSVSYKVLPKLFLNTRLGYGVAAERAASQGSFTQSNNISGALSIGCVYQF